MLKVLDCTLRDGGYVNEWNFGENNIAKIVNSLNNAGVEIIELGFVKPGIDNSADLTIKPSINNFDNLATDNNKLYAVMINYGECFSNDLPFACDTSIKAIRIAFKKKDRKEALVLSKELLNKGYMVFLQPMVSLSYSNDEFVNLIKEANIIKPYAFYIVDSFGEMNESQLGHYLSLANNFLNKDINLGFHSHNNLQLSFSNCKAFINNNKVHNLIVDSSIYGMGRGAGNLNTEIFLDYLNNNCSKTYLVNPIINVIDLYFDKLLKEKYWGYSIPFYISAKHHTHPNYALFLDNKKTLTFFDIERIISSIRVERRDTFDKEYISSLYIQYQEKETYSDYKSLAIILENKKIVLIGPGPSIRNLAKLPNECNDAIFIGVNHYPTTIKCDYFFFSNNKRYNQFDKIGKTIITSNIYKKGDYIMPYFELINNNDFVFDNSLLMCLKLMIKIKAKHVFLAGFDGYSDNSINDYLNNELWLGEKNNKKTLNSHISGTIEEYKKQIPISFVTESRYFTK